MQSAMGNDDNAAAILRKKRSAFSLLELLLVVALLGILFTLGVPGLLQLAQSSRLQGAGQATYGILQEARSQALAEQRDYFVVWQTAGTESTDTASTTPVWCAAISQTPDCNCLTEECPTQGVPRRLQSHDYIGVALAKAAFVGGPVTGFDGLRGLAEGRAGTVRYQLTNEADTPAAELRVIVSALGRVRLCQVGATAVSGVGLMPCG